MSRLFAVIGQPVGHSLSPLIHSAFFRREKLAARYERAEVAPHEVQGALVRLAELGFQGLNVTFPLKQAVMPFLASLDETARELGAVNTLVVGESGFRGLNTDGAGFGEFVEREMGLTLAGRRVLFLGAGNTVRSILLELARRGVRAVRLVNRSRERLADPALTRLGALFPSFEPLAQDEIARWDEVFEADLVVQATNLGLSGSAGTFPWPLEQLRADVPVVDLNYLAGRRTPFLARIPHVRHVADGKGMLLYQAAKAFEHWWGFFPRVDGLLGELFPDGLE